MYSLNNMFSDPALCMYQKRQDTCSSNVLARPLGQAKHNETKA
jgi:hypothetical protein